MKKMMSVFSWQPSPVHHACLGSTSTCSTSSLSEHYLWTLVNQASHSWRCGDPHADRQSWSARGNVVILIAPRRVSSTPANAYILASRFRKMVDVDFLEGPALCWLAHAQTTHDLFCSVRTRGSQLKPQFICNR